jgi:sugar/nucleoside kinase (ribokinase family)
MPEICCLGIAVADVIGNPVDRLPKPSTLMPCPHISLHTGGCAVNTASALARMGIKASVIGAVGRDGFGAFMRHELDSRGLDIRGLKSIANASTSASIVVINRQGERGFIHDVGANALLTARDVDWSFLRRHKLVHVAGSFLMPRLDGKPLAGVLKRARGLGLKTSLDTVYNPELDWARVLKPCLPHLDFFLPSLEEAKQISGKTDPKAMLRAFHALGPKVVGIKMGARGSCFFDGRQEVFIPAPLIRPKDTTGAGDSFCAGFLYGIVKGLNLQACGKLANTLGSACCLGLGANAGVANRAEAAKLMKKWYGCSMNSKIN